MRLRSYRTFKLVFTPATSMSEMATISSTPSSTRWPGGVQGQVEKQVSLQLYTRIGVVKVSFVGQGVACCIRIVGTSYGLRLFHMGSTTRLFIPLQDFTRHTHCGAFRERKQRRNTGPRCSNAGSARRDSIDYDSYLRRPSWNPERQSDPLRIPEETLR